MTPKRYTRTTAKKHVMKTVPFRVTKQTRKEALDNTNISEVMRDVDEALKNLLVAIAKTPVENFGISLVNTLLMKLMKRMKKMQNAKKKK